MYYEKSMNTIIRNIISGTDISSIPLNLGTGTFQKFFQIAAAITQVTPATVNQTTFAKIQRFLKISNRFCGTPKYFINFTSVRRNCMRSIWPYNTIIETKFALEDHKFPPPEDIIPGRRILNLRIVKARAFRSL